MATGDVIGSPGEVSDTKSNASAYSSPNSKATCDVNGKAEGIEAVLLRHLR